MVTGLRGLCLSLGKSDRDCSIVSESADPRVRGEISSELLRSGKLRDSSRGLCLCTGLDSCVGGPLWARWSSGVGGRMCSDGGGWGTATGTVTATLAGLSTRSSGTTVAALGLGRGRRRRSSQSNLTSSWTGESHTPLECVWESKMDLAESSGSAPRACSTATPRKWCKEGEDMLLLWESERPREWDEGLHNGSGRSDRSLSEWERHSLLCLCLLWKQRKIQWFMSTGAHPKQQAHCTHVSIWKHTWPAEFPDTPPVVSWRKGLVWWRLVFLSHSRRQCPGPSRTPS